MGFSVFSEHVFSIFCVFCIGLQGVLGMTIEAILGPMGGTDGDLLVVRVTAAPVDGAANEALVRVLAKALGLPRRDVVIVSGATSRTKIVEVAGLDVTEVRRRLQLDGEVG